jgi:hypothetical protein
MRKIVIYLHLLTIACFFSKVNTQEVFALNFMIRISGLLTIRTPYDRPVFFLYSSV